MVVAQVEVGSRPEWWERLQQRWLRWLSRRSSVRWVFRGVLIGGVVALLVAAATVPRFGDGLRVWWACWLLLLGWLVVTPTKTLRWASVARFFSVSIVWAAVVAWLSAGLARRVGLPVVGGGPTVAI